MIVSGIELETLMRKISIGLGDNYSRPPFHRIQQDVGFYEVAEENNSSEVSSRRYVVEIGCVECLHWEVA